MTRHAARTVRVFALYNNAVEGQHFAVVRSGTWAEVCAYLSVTARYAGGRAFFIEGSDGQLRPLMA